MPATYIALPRYLIKTTKKPIVMAHWLFIGNLSLLTHIWSESKYDNFDIPNIPKTDPDSPKRALSDRAMG